MKKESKLILILAATTCAASVSAMAIASAATNADTTFAPEDWYYTATVTVSKDTPQTIGLDGVTSGDYVLSIQPYYTEYVEEAPTYWAQLDTAEKEVELTENIYMYGELTGDFTIAEGDTQFTISTDYAETVEVYVMLYPVLEQAALPTSEETKTTFDLWENYEFQYTHTGETGFYTMTPHSSVEGAEFGIEMKSNPVYYTGDTIPDANYPAYLKNGTTYYFSMALVGLPEGTSETVNSVEAYFTFASWTHGTLDATRREYVPVSSDSTIYIVPLEGLVEDYTYDITLTQLPAYARELEVTAHFVNKDGDDAIDPIISASGLFEFVNNADIYGVYFTSNAADTYAALATLQRAPSPSVDIPVGTPTAVTMQAGETVPCTVTDIPYETNYSIVITGSNQVVVGNTYQTIIAAGETEGMFPMYLDRYVADQYVGSALNFTNTSEQDLTVYVTIKQSEVSYNIYPEIPTSITVNPQSEITYFVPDLVSGTYLITLTGSENVAVYEYTNRIEPIAFGTNGRGLYSLSLGEDITSVSGAFTFKNSGSETATVTFLIEPVNSINVGYENEITVKGTQDYYIGGLETGRYQVELSNLPEGAVVSIMYGQTEIALNDEHIGYFTVVVPEGERSAIAVLTITVTGVDEATFGITVTETTDGDMELGVAQTVTLGANNTRETYALALVSGKEYTVTLEGVPEGVSVYVAIDGYYTVLYAGNTATFTMGFDSSTVQFTYFSSEVVTSFTFTATITEVVNE